MAMLEERIQRRHHRRATRTGREVFYVSDALRDGYDDRSGSRQSGIPVIARFYPNPSEREIKRAGIGENSTAILKITRTEFAEKIQRFDPDARFLIRNIDTGFDEEFHIDDPPTGSGHYGQQDVVFGLRREK